MANIRQDCKASCRKLRRMPGEKHQKGICVNGYIRIARDLGTGQKAPYRDMRSRSHRRLDRNVGSLWKDFRTIGKVLYGNRHQG